MYPVHRNSIPATVQERACYAALLAKCGLADEALDLLKKTGARTADVALFAGFAEMNRWEYANAIPHFDLYLRKFKVSDYERAVAELNLAASYIFNDQIENAKPILESLLESCEGKPWARLRSNILELSAQAAARGREWDLAEKWLNEAAILSAQDSTTNLFVEKWRAILDLKSQGPRPELLDELKIVRKKAVEAGDWETVRDSDFHLASVLRDPELASRVYFGTPYKSYRTNLENELKDWFTVSDRFIWTGSERPAERTFDLQAGRELTGEARLKPGQAMHRLLLALTSDMYRPHQGGALFAKVFRGEYFSPTHSLQRVFQLAYRLRSWFQENDIPLDIIVKDGGYRLIFTGAYGLIFTRPKRGRQPEIGAHHAALLDILKQEWPYKSFSSAQALERLGISPRALKILLRQAVQERQILSSGRGRSVLYRFAK